MAVTAARATPTLITQHDYSHIIAWYRETLPKAPPPRPARWFDESDLGLDTRARLGLSRAQPGLGSPGLVRLLAARFTQAGLAVHP